MPLSGAHGSTYALSLSLYQLLESHEKKTPYDWQKHPHAHIKITVKVKDHVPMVALVLRHYTQDGKLKC